MSTRYYPLLLLCMLLLGSCAKQPDEIRINLTSRERALIDTMYLERVAELRPYWDSLCTVAHDSLLRVAVDSLLVVRREEEARLRSRIVLPKE